MTLVTKTFIFADEFCNNLAKKCETKITIEEKISNNSLVFNISYEHVIIDNEKRITVRSVDDLQKPCPFAYSTEEARDNYEGVIVIKNEMTSAMVKFLMMDDDELSRHSGNSTPQHYRELIMVELTHFWD